MHHYNEIEIGTNGTVSINKISGGTNIMANLNTILIPMV
jgi:hypothetical protein